MPERELTLLVDACRVAYDGGEPTVIDGWAMNWNWLASLAVRHRVQALCWHGLATQKHHIPIRVAKGLAEASREIIGQSMRSAAECGRLHRALGRAGVDHLFVKGVTLGALAYQNAFLKMGMDIDLLVRGDQLLPALAALRSAGYVPVSPAIADDQQVARWHSRSKESSWCHAASSCQLDLHTRLADQPSLIPTIGVHSPRQIVAVAPGIELPTLAADELFAYLCVHGSSSAWFRLKWICDLAALLHGKTAKEVDQLYEQSQQLGAGRAAGQALLVADEIFKTSMSDELRTQLRADRITRWLAAVAVRQLWNDREPLDRPLGTFWIHASQLVLSPGSATKGLIRRVVHQFSRAR